MSQAVAAHHCGDCNRPAKVLMRIGRDRDDWLYETCDDCLEEVCSEHVEYDGERTLCETCYQQKALRRHDP